jgi:hypothetical protein
MVSYRLGHARSSKYLVHQDRGGRYARDQRLTAYVWLIYNLDRYKRHSPAAC